MPFGKMGSNLKPEQPAGLDRHSIETYLVSVSKNLVVNK